MDSLIVVGLMSGTSVDGIDASLVKINPDMSFENIENIVFEYPKNIREEIFKLFSPYATIKDLCWMNFIIGEYFAKAVILLAKKANVKLCDIDLIGSHGQTIYHIPVDEKINNLSKRSTLQIGEASVIAQRTGVTTVSDFRTMDIAAGGQGAPLVCFADKLMFLSDSITRAVQNIGGMANVTLVSPNTDVIAFDTGPGNVLIDYFSKKFFNVDYDFNGDFAKRGIVDEYWLNFLLSDSYYSQLPPKSTGREYFSADYAQMILKEAPASEFDIMATVTALTAKSIFNAYRDFIYDKTNVDEIVLGGGGAYNLQIINFLKGYFGNNVKIKTHEDFDISNKFKEAIAFALLAYSSYYKIPNNIPSCTGALKNCVLGKIIYE